MDGLAIVSLKRFENDLGCLVAAESIKDLSYDSYKELKLEKKSSSIVGPKLI